MRLLVVDKRGDVVDKHKGWLGYSGAVKVMKTDKSALQLATTYQLPVEASASHRRLGKSSQSINRPWLLVSRCALLT